MSCFCNNNYSPKKIHKSGLKYMPYTWTSSGLYTSSGIYLRGISPSTAQGAQQNSVTVATPYCCDIK